MCRGCGYIHYINPKIIAGCIIEQDGKYLLCQRAIPPRPGTWTLPAGFMENGESTAQAAVRETREEACASVTIDQLFAMINIPHINQVHLFYRGQMLDATFAAGEESLETGLFSEQRIPWDDLAFRSVVLCLRKYFADRRKGRFAVHETTLPPP